MHEMALTEGVLQIVEEAAGTQGVARAKVVVPEIGLLSAVESEAMRFCFDAAARGTLAEGAHLEVIAVPGEDLCLNCHETVPLAALYDPARPAAVTRSRRPAAPKRGSRSWKSNSK